MHQAWKANFPIHANALPLLYWVIKEQSNRSYHRIQDLEKGFPVQVSSITWRGGRVLRDQSEVQLPRVTKTNPCCHHCRRPCWGSLCWSDSRPSCFYHCAAPVHSDKDMLLLPSSLTSSCPNRLGCQNFKPCLQHKGISNTSQLHLQFILSEDRSWTTTA